MARLAVLAWQQGAGHSLGASLQLLFPQGGKVCSSGATARHRQSWRRPGTSSSHPTEHRSAASHRLIHPAFRLMCCRIWVRKYSNCRAILVQMFLTCSFTCIQKLRKCASLTAACVPEQNMLSGLHSSNIPNGLDAKSVYRGVAASVREHLIDAFNRTQDYWR